MKTWLSYVKQGFSRKVPADAISGMDQLPTDIRKNLKHIYPFVLRHWRKGVLGAGLIFVGTLLSFPQPLISRYFIDTVIGGRRLSLLPGVVLLMVAISGCSILCGLLQQFYVARFEQRVTMDIQESLLGHVLRLPQAFFDSKETGYLMSRLSSDVGGLQWFFSSTIVHIVTNVLRFAGGIWFLLWLEWRLALAAIIVLPGLFFMIRYFSARLRVMSHWLMEQHAQIFSRFQECLSSVPLIKAFSTEEREVFTVISGVRRMVDLSLEQSTVNSIAGLAIGSMPRAVNLASPGDRCVLGDHRPLDPRLPLCVSELSRVRVRPGAVPGVCQSRPARRQGISGACLCPFRARPGGEYGQRACRWIGFAARSSFGTSPSRMMPKTLYCKRYRFMSSAENAWPSSVPAAWVRPPW